MDTLISLVGSDGRVVVTPELAALAADLEQRDVVARVGCSGDSQARVHRGEHGPDGPIEDVLLAATASVTRGIAGVARSGTVVVGPGGGNGGLLACLPPLHVVVLDERDIVDSLAEALARVADRFEELGGEAVFVSGPSRTADIEMMSVVGVHGPLALHVVILLDGET